MAWPMSGLASEHVRMGVLAALIAVAAFAAMPLWVGGLCECRPLPSSKSLQQEAWACAIQLYDT